jgi:hypothetical protein
LVNAVVGACSGEDPLVLLPSEQENAGMFLHKNRKRCGGEVYEYWTLCESVRTKKIQILIISDLQKKKRRIFGKKKPKKAVS